MYTRERYWAKLFIIIDVGRRIQVHFRAYSRRSSLVRRSEKKKKKKKQKKKKKTYAETSNSGFEVLIKQYSGFRGRGRYTYTDWSFTFSPTWQLHILAPFVHSGSEVRQCHNEWPNRHDNGRHCQPFCFLSSGTHETDKDAQDGSWKVVGTWNHADARAWKLKSPFNWWSVYIVDPINNKTCRKRRAALISNSYIYESSHEIMVFFVLRKIILPTHMRNHPVGLDVWFCSSTSVLHVCKQRRLWRDCAEKALARLRECAGSPEPSLIAYVISITISWAGSYFLSLFFFFVFLFFSINQWSSKTLTFCQFFNSSLIVSNQIFHMEQMY